MHTKKLVELCFYNNLANNKNLLGSLYDRTIDEQFKAMVLSYVIILDRQDDDWFYHCYGTTVEDIVDKSKEILLGVFLKYWSNTLS